jgi:hypothetical protein
MLFIVNNHGDRQPKKDLTQVRRSCFLHSVRIVRTLAEDLIALTVSLICVSSASLYATAIPFPLLLMLLPFSCPFPFITTSPSPLLPSPEVSPPPLVHPGQLCTTSWQKTSQSTQKCLSQEGHSYLLLSLAPSALFNCSAPSLTSLLLGGVGKALRQPKHLVDFFATARCQETSFQRSRGKRWW